MGYSFYAEEERKHISEYKLQDYYACIKKQARQDFSSIKDNSLYQVVENSYITGWIVSRIEITSDWLYKKFLNDLFEYHQTYQTFSVKEVESEEEKIIVRDNKVPGYDNLYYLSQIGENKTKVEVDKIIKEVYSPYFKMKPSDVEKLFNMIPPNPEEDGNEKE